MNSNFPDLSDFFDDDDDEDEDLELMNLKLLRRMRPQLEDLESSDVAARDPKTMAAVKRLLEQERIGEVDFESDEYDSDLRLAVLGLMRIDFEEMKRLGTWPPPGWENGETRSPG